MATQKSKTPKELTVEDRLKAIYRLQTILSEIDRIRTLRGELPHEVQDMEDEIAGLETRVANYKEELATLRAEVVKHRTNIEAQQSPVARYSEQQNNVRNNKEFDQLTKEIEFCTLDIQLSEKRINEANNQQEIINGKLTDAEANLLDLRTNLTEKRNELEEIVSETRQDEERLQQEAKKLESQIDDQRLLTAFKRIRRNARNGLGIVYVQRNACGGCFNRIPPQRQMEIKMHKKIIVCEYCGRIMIDPELAGVQPEA